MDVGYYRILNKNKAILIPFFDYPNYTASNEYFKNQSLVGKFFQKLCCFILQKKIQWIKSKYPESSLFLSDIISHTAKHQDVLRLYDMGVPLIDDFILCLKNEKFICADALAYLKEFENSKMGSRWGAFCNILDIYLASSMNRYSQDKNGCAMVIYGYCFGILDKDKALFEIKKMNFKIPKTIQLIEKNEHSYVKLEETFVKELNS